MAANTTMSEYAYCECLLEFQKDIKKELAQTGIHAEKLMEKARKKKIYTQEKPQSARGSSNSENIISLLVSNCIENVKQNPLQFNMFLQFLKDVGLQQLVAQIRCKFQELSDKKHKTSLDSNAYTDSGINVLSEPLPPLQGSSELVSSVPSSTYSSQKGLRATTSSGALHTPNQSGDGPYEKENSQSSLSRVSNGVSLIQAMEETQNNVTGYAPVLNSMPRLLPADNQDIKNLTLDTKQAEACHYEEAEGKKEAAEKENEEMKVKNKLQQPLTYGVNKTPLVPEEEAQEDEAKHELVSLAVQQSIIRNAISNQNHLLGATEPETVNTELETEIQELREGNELLTKEIQETNKKKNVLEAEKKHREKELEGKIEEIRKLEAEKGLRVEELEGFKAKTAELEQKLQQKVNENKEQEKRFSEQEKQFSEQEKEICDLKKQIKEVEHKTQEKELEIEKLGKKSLQKELERLELILKHENEKRAIEKERDDLKVKLTLQRYLKLEEEKEEEEWKRKAAEEKKEEKRKRKAAEEEKEDEKRKRKAAEQEKEEEKQKRKAAEEEKEEEKQKRKAAEKEKEEEKQKRKAAEEEKEEEKQKRKAAEKEKEEEKQKRKAAEDEKEEEERKRKAAEKKTKEEKQKRKAAEKKEKEEKQKRRISETIQLECHETTKYMEELLKPKTEHKQEEEDQSCKEEKSKHKTAEEKEEAERRKAVETQRESHNKIKELNEQLPSSGNTGVAGPVDVKTLDFCKFGEPDLKTLMNLVGAYVKAKWEAIGVGLLIETADLNAFKSNNGHKPDAAEHCMHNVFVEWDTARPSEYSWQNLADVLKSPAVKEIKLVEQLYNALND